MTTKTSLFLKLLVGMCLLLMANSAFAAGVTLPACSAMAGSNELCGSITGLLTLQSGPDPLGLNGSTITAVTGVPNSAEPPTSWTGGWSVLGAPVNPGSSASYVIPLTLASNKSPFVLTCGPGSAAGVTLNASGSGDSLNVNTCNLYLYGSNVSSTFTANINFAAGTLPQAIPLPFASVAIGSGSSATYVCNDSGLCPTALGQATTLTLSSGTVTSTCVGCTTLGVVPAVGTGLTFTMTQGGATPPSQTITVKDSSPVAVVSYADVPLVTTPTGGTWLSVASPGGQVLSSGSANPFNVNVTPGSLGPGTYSGSVTVYGPARNNPVVEPVTFIITAVPLTITTASLPNGEVGAAYSQTLAAAGGVPPYSNWTVSSGSLPAGLSLSASSGVISGSPTTTGTSSFSVTVKDSANTTSPAQPLSITINAGPTITTTSLPGGTVGVAYSQTLAAANGTPPYSNWTVSSGSLPAGLSLNSSSGTISGTPSATGTASFFVTVKDNAGSTSAAQPLSITVVTGLSITTTSLPNGEVGVAYSQTLGATGGTPPYSNWTVSTGSLPAGLSLSASSGVISGTPTTAGSPPFSVTVMDHAGNTSAAQPLTIAIIGPPAVSTTSLPNGEVGLAYSQTLAATGGTPPYSNWTVSSGSLPAGLSLNSSSGAITGTPSATGTAPFFVTVKDSVGGTSAAQSLSITIVAGVTISTTSLPNGTVGVGYAQTLAATGGTPPYSNWTVTSGSLPAGLTLNSASGVISGTPTTAGSAPFSVTVKDTAGETSPPASLSISIIAPLTITTTSLPNGTVGVAYSQTLAASGGTPPYGNWTIATGALPAGLTLNSSSGLISGTPTTIGSSSFSVTVKDNAGVTSPPQSLSITINQNVTITTTSLPNGTVGVAYSQTLAATGGTPPYSNWTVATGSLPAGLSLNSSTGTISGTPTATGTSSFSVTVKDSIGSTSPAQPLSITIIAPLTITTTSLPNGTVGISYSQTLVAAGGTPPYSNWTVTSGSLPAGLSLNSSTGTISGTPTTAGTSPFSVTVKDSAGNTSPAASLSITIIAPLTITTTSLPPGTVGVAYSQTLVAAGGTPPYGNWTLASGALPAGLTLNSSSGLISGTPTNTGTSSFSVTVKDHAGVTSPPQSLSITINQGVTVTTTSLPNGVVGVAYSQTLAATGGTPPYSNWTVATGSLPAGLTLSSSSGVISGTPTAAGTASFTVTVKDNAGSTSPAQSLSITIVSGLTITTTSLPNGTVGSAYSQTLTAAGGTPPYSNWTVTTGSLPAGLSLNASTGLISGTPTTAGTSPFSVTVKDSASTTSPPQPLSITIVNSVTITTTSLPNGTVGTSYNQTLAATGGTPPYSNWTVSSGSLPAGLSLSASSGVISGTPTTPGASSFSVTVKDFAGNTSPAQALSITIIAPLTITTTSLPGGTVGLAYSQTLTATGGTPPYSNWTVATGSLPAGLSLNASTGVLSGTPTAAGTSSFSVTVKDNASNTSPAQALSITIAASLTITTTSLPNATVGVSYSQTLAATGGTPPYSNWTVTTGSLPAGLSLNASTGLISGTPTTAGASPFSVTVKDSANTTSPAQSLSITVISGVTVTTTSLPNGTVGTSYNQSLAAAGGTPPYSNWTVTSGSLPAGLSLNASSGVISGTPTAAGTASFSVTVKDNAGHTSPAQALSITVIAPLTITTASLPNGTVGVSYSQTLAATGGTPPYSNWTVTSGSLPAGLTLNAATGAISGTPTTVGSPSFSVTVKDNAGNTSPSQALSLTIVPGVTVTTASLPNGSVGVAYSQTLAATGGTPPYANWTVSAGSLPAGLTLSSASGVISGTPTAAGTASFSVTVKDSAGSTSPAQALTITVAAGVAITTTTLPNGSVGVAYSQTLGAVGGTPPYSNWTVSSGSLPAGLTLSSASGVISGTPTAAGTASFSVTVKDHAGNTSTAQALSITISSGVTITTTSLPSGAVGVAYAQTLTAIGGTPPYSNWTVTTGSLPAGLILSSATGVISGTPTAGGIYSFSVTVRDNAGNTSPAQALSITIIGPLTITTASLPNATLGVSYSQTLTAAGGTPPYSSWTVTSGSLPPGLALNAATGLISGTPTTATGSPFTFSVTVRDSANSTSPPKTLSLAIGAAQLRIGTPSTYIFTLANTAPPATGVVSIIASDGSAQPFTVTAASTSFNWLTFTPTSGVTPANITLTANPAGLLPGTYLTPLTVRSGALTLTIPAQLNVTGSNLAVSPTMLSFAFQRGLALPPAQTLSLTTISGTGTVPLASVTTDVDWLKVTPASSAPALLQVSISPGLLAPGTYLGAVIVRGVGSPDTSLQISVMLTVTIAPQLTATPGALTFNYQIGGTAPAAQSFMVTTNGNAPVTFTATSPGNWLTLSPQSGTTPASVLVTANPAGLAPGTYGGTINVTAPGTASAAVTVTLIIGGPPQLTFNPSHLTFVSPVGGPAPAPQTLNVTSTGAPLAFTAAAGSIWLGVTPTSGTTPAALTVSVNPAGLATGVYNGTINITQAGSANPQMIMVMLEVGNVTPTIAGVINAASGAVGTVVPGMAISIFGSLLGPTTAASFALPPAGGTVATTLAGTQVLFDGTPAPVLFTMNGQVNALAPFELANKTSTVLTVSYNGVPSAGMKLPVGATLPGLFTANATGKGQGAILNQDYGINSSSNPAAQGSTVMLFGTGGGPTNPPSTDGALNPLPPPLGALTATTVTAMVGGQPATVTYSGPAPGLVAGIFQINVTLPSGIPSGNVPLTVTVGTATSQTVTVAVQ